MKASSEKLIEYINKFYPNNSNVHSVYEAGFSGFSLQRDLELAGVKNIVIHPASLEVSRGDRVKTDKKDAKKLAIQLDAKRLKGIRIPSMELEAKRQLTRTRSQLVKHRTRTKNQIRSKFYYFGFLSPTETRQMSFKLVSEVISNNAMGEDVLVSIESLVSLWEAQNAQINNLEKKLHGQALDDEREKLYRQLPGFGAFTARVLSNEGGDLLEFSNCKKLYSFTGLTPSERSSGEKVRKGSISKAGNTLLRHVLIEAAWRAISQDTGLRRDFERIANRGSKNKAIVAIARKLIGRARALLRDKKAYAPFSVL
jgi:transposase